MKSQNCCLILGVMLASCSGSPTSKTKNGCGHPTLETTHDKETLNKLSTVIEGKVQSISIWIAPDLGGKAFRSEELSATNLRKLIQFLQAAEETEETKSMEFASVDFEMNDGACFRIQIDVCGEGGIYFCVNEEPWYYKAGDTDKLASILRNE